VGKNSQFKVQNKKTLKRRHAFGEKSAADINQAKIGHQAVLDVIKKEV
jgi:hypothetical protein